MQGTPQERFGLIIALLLPDARQQKAMPLLQLFIGSI